MKTEILEVLRNIASHEEADRDEKGKDGELLHPHLRTVTSDQFAILFPFLCQKLEDLKLEDRDYYVFSSDQRGKLKRAKFIYVWQIFCEDWRNYHDKTVHGEMIIGSFAMFIEIPFNFRICFLSEQKAQLPH
ncbi:MAG: hypothetical protein WCO66_01845 [Candidatus Absconditabacteria bacterium]